MTKVIVLDTGPLGLLTHRGGKPEVDDCKAWLRQSSAAGARILIPEIADYELRRELIRAGKAQGIARLNNLIAQTYYAPITTKAMRLASDLWAQIRNQGLSTAPDNALDGDVILAAQALLLENGIDDIVIATTNVAHLSRFAKAEVWRSIA